MAARMLDLKQPPAQHTLYIVTRVQGAMPRPFSWPHPRPASPWSHGTPSRRSWRWSSRMGHPSRLLHKTHRFHTGGVPFVVEIDRAPCAAASTPSLSIAGCCWCPLTSFASIQSIAGCIWYAWILLAFHYYVHVSMYAERISGSYWILFSLLRFE